MSRNIVNLFRLDNWHELSFEYRLVEVTVTGAGNDSKLENKAFFTAMSHLMSQTKGPAAIVYHEGKRHIAVKADATVTKQTLPGAPLNINISPVGGTLVWNSQSLSDENLDMALQFLESAIKYQINKNRTLWDGGGNSFLKKISLKKSADIGTDIYHGFKYKLIALDKNNVFFCIDLAYRYAERLNLHEKLKLLPKEQHQNVIFGKNFLYQNGDDWYVVKGKSVADRIDKYQMPFGGSTTTVYEYNLKHGKYAVGKSYKPALLPSSETFLHSYTNNSSKSYPGVACLAKAIRKAEDGLHRNSINEANARFRRIEFHVVNYFQRLNFNGKALVVSKRPHEVDLKIFSIPALKFGKKAILDPYAGEVKYGSPIDHFPKMRREFIFKNGIITDSGFAAPYIFLPDNLPYALAKGLKYYMDNLLKRIAPQFPGFTIHTYPVKDYPFASKVYRGIEKVIKDKNLAGGYGILVLPDNMDETSHFTRDLHHIVKKELFDAVKMKCVSANKLRSFLRPVVTPSGHTLYKVLDANMPKFKSYLANTVFEYLIINRKWPYALAEKLNNDIYIGIDAHDFYAGFVFFFGNGEKIVFDVEKVAKNTGSFRNEKINYRVIEDKIYNILYRHLKGTGERPGSIVILRDGVSFGEEEKALRIALSRLEQAGLMVADQVRSGIIDVAKSSVIPLRAASFIGNSSNLTNPEAGRHMIIRQSRHAFIFNTGAPYKVEGSSTPIQVTYSSGNINFEKTLEDIFRLTQITFSSPDRPTSLPLPLKLIDTLIRDVAHEMDFRHTEQEETKLYQPSLN